jgi:integrase
MFVQRIKAIFESAIEDGVVTKNPAVRIKNPKPIKRPETGEPFTELEISRLLEASKGEDRNFVALLVGTGLRPGEVLALRPKDIDLERRKITVSGSVGRFGEGPTKTRQVRVVDATDAVAPVITALTRQRRHNRIPRLFKFDFTNWRSRNWKRIIERADVSYRSPYALRHTFAVRMLVLRFDPVYIAGQLGHMSTEMLHRHYARWAVGAPITITSKRRSQ